MTARRPRRFRRRFFLGLAGLLALGLLAAGAGTWLVRTTAGARWLAARWLAREPRLTGTVGGGDLRSGLRLREISWRDGTNQVALDSLEARWSFSVLPRPRFRIRQLRAEGLRIEIPGNDSPETAPAESPASFRWPVEIAFAGVRLRDARVRFGATAVDLGEACLDGRFRDATLDLTAVRLQDFGWRVPEPAAPAPAPAATWYERLAPANRSPVVLPDVRLPLDVRIRAFTLERGRLDLGATTQRIAALSFSADWIDDQATIRRFRLDHEWGQAEAEGTLRPSGEYPVDLVLRIRTDRLLPPHDWTLDLALTNRLADLAFAAHLAGPGDLDARGTVRPLDPRLPLEVALNWSRLAWPPTNAVATSESGRLNLRGSLESVALEAAATLAGPNLPAGEWTLQATSDLRQIEIAEVAGQLLGGTLRAAGALSWTNGLAWTLAGEGAGLRLDALLPNAPAPVAGQLATTGRWTEDGWQTEFEIAHAAAEWRGYPLAATGRIAGSSAAGWSTPDLRVAVRDNAVRIAGSWSGPLDFHGELDLRDLSQLLPDGAGRIAGNWSLRGPPNQPDVALSAQATGLAWRDRIRAEAARLEIHVAALARAESRLSLEIDSIAVANRAGGIETLRLDVAGTRARHRAACAASGAQAEGSFELAGGLGDDFSAWTGRLERAAGAIAGIDWSLVDPPDLRWNGGAGQFVVAPHRWRHAQAEFAVPEPLVLGAAGAAHARLTGFPLEEFHAWLPADLRLRGTLDATAAARWTPDQAPQASVALDLREAGIRLIVADEAFMEDAPPIDVAFETVALRADLAGTNLAARLDFAAPGLGTVQAAAAASRTADGALADWHGQVDVQALKLDVAQPFVAELRRLSGEVDAALRLSGDFRRPRIDGTVSLTNGTIEPAVFPVELDHVHLQGEFRGDRAEWSGGFRSGDGQATLAGETEFGGETWQVRLDLAGERLDLAYDTLAVLQASPDLSLRASPGELALTGTVRVPRAEIQLQPLPETAVRTSPDAIVVDEVPESMPAAPESAPAAGTRTVQIDLQLGNRVSIGGRGISGRLAGTLRLRQEDAAAPQAFGELRIEDGRYRAYGQRLQIRRGLVVFAGPLDRPHFSLEAVRDVPAHGVVAGLRLEGPPDALRTSLFSEPPLPEEDVLVFLVLGRPLARGEDVDTNAMLARAALALGVSRGGGAATAAAERLGIDEFQIDTAGEGDDTQVVVSGMVSSRLQLGYGVGVFAPANTLTLRYRLARHLFLEAASGIESALDLLYTFRF